MTTRVEPRLPQSNRIGQFEQSVLSAVNVLTDAYGVTIRAHLRKNSDKPVKFGFIYNALDRLENEGYVQSWMSEPLPERGGYAKRCYRIEPDGEVALREAATATSPIFGAIPDGERI